ncbi:hypothetical protein GTR02_22220, partial [Kineococcus sp. R8]|uniref:hypothetical protein n=1 Tax=Kineococcus siccus TaxID=2696567 RepID=UPI0014136D0D
AHLNAHGIPAAPYTGATDNAERLQAEDDLIHDRVKALVATSALTRSWMRSSSACSRSALSVAPV